MSQKTQYHNWEKLHIDTNFIKCATYTLNWKSNTIANGTKDSVLDTSNKLGERKAYSGWSNLRVALCG